jgi:protein tyrosine phosphatase (PTP) superfamily phosphohydrolase (DUF442 family)
MVCAFPGKASSLIILASVWLGAETGAAQDRSPAAKSIERIEADRLPNPIRVHPRVISGGLPSGDAAFAELRELGVQTIISVDAATPDVQLARRYGLRYVHLPHGYDGIPGHRVRELAKAVESLPGPVYVHCHHGKHRSPTAAAVACVAAGLIPSEVAEDVLDLAGTSSRYQGLFAAAREATPIAAEELKQLQVELPEIAEVPPLAEAMTDLSHTFEHIQQIAENQWRATPEHPDLEPAHEALLLREHFTELQRANSPIGDRLDFRDWLYRGWLHESESAALQLERSLRASPPAGELPVGRLNTLLQRLKSGCTKCHSRFRDVPLAGE